MSIPRRDMHIVAASTTLLLVGAYAVGVVFALLDAISGDPPLPTWQYISLPLPLIAFVPATVAALAIYSTSSIEQGKAQSRRALGLTFLGWLVYIGLIFLGMNTRGA